METSVIVILVSYCPPVDGWIVLSSKPGTSKTINPLLEGFQRTTAGPVKKIKIISSEFVQIFHTGSQHWVCVSSIDVGRTPGFVNLYDSQFVP